jgi:hypothetical protein
MDNNDITVDVALYGPVARVAGGHHIATQSMQLTAETRMGDLTARLGLDGSDIGYVFVNAVLCDVPGMNVSRDLLLQDGDHIGIFSRVHMWPYQYRDGVRMSPALKEALSERGAMHHTYSSSSEGEGPSA